MSGLPVRCRRARIPEIECASLRGLSSALSVVLHYSLGPRKSSPVVTALVPSAVLPLSAAVRGGVSPVMTAVSPQVSLSLSVAPRLRLGFVKSGLFTSCSSGFGFASRGRYAFVVCPFVLSFLVFASSVLPVLVPQVVAVAAGIASTVPAGVYVVYMRKAVHSLRV